MSTDHRPRTRPRLLLVVVAVLAVCFAGAAAFAAAGGNGQGNNGVGGGNGGSTGAGSPGQAFKVAVASTVPVAPGRAGSVTVTVTNPNNQAANLTSLSGTITSVTSVKNKDIPACSMSWIKMGSWVGTKAVAAKSSTTLTMPVTFNNLATTNQDNCKGVAYTFSFTVNGQQA